MAFRKFVELDAQDTVIATCEGDVVDPISPGLTEIDPTVDRGGLLGQRLDRSVPGLPGRAAFRPASRPLPPTPIRRIRAEAFRRRWTEAEETTLETIAADVATQAGPQVRVLLRRLYAEALINLDGLEVRHLLERLCVRLTEAGAVMDSAQRIAALLADGTPDEA